MMPDDAIKPVWVPSCLLKVQHEQAEEIRVRSSPSDNQFQGLYPTDHQDHAARNQDGEDAHMGSDQEADPESRSVA